MGQRYYDPALARWNAQDLMAGGLTSPQSFNRYASVLGNPISAIDPRGLCIPQGFIGPVSSAELMSEGGYCLPDLAPTITQTVPLSFGQSAAQPGSCSALVLWSGLVISALGVIDALPAGIISRVTSGAGGASSILGAGGICS
jgi:hypothetical protein